MYKLTLLLLVLGLVFAGVGCKEEGAGDEGITATESSIEGTGEEAAEDKSTVPAAEKSEESREGEEYKDTETVE